MSDDVFASTLHPDDSEFFQLMDGLDDDKEQSVEEESEQSQEEGEQQPQTEGEQQSQTEGVDCEMGSKAMEQVAEDFDDSGGEEEDSKEEPVARKKGKGPRVRKGGPRRRYPVDMTLEGIEAMKAEVNADERLSNAEKRLKRKQLAALRSRVSKQSGLEAARAQSKKLRGELEQVLFVLKGTRDLLDQSLSANAGAARLLEEGGGDNEQDVDTCVHMIGEVMSASALHENGLRVAIEAAEALLQQSEGLE